MTDENAPYAELKPELQRISGPLFEFAEQQVRKRGVFLPFGASLHQNGEIALEAATSGAKKESAIDVLPLLHEGLRQTVARGGVAAIAVCEWVKITRQGGKQTDAMKVLIEHERGLTIAFYVPCRKHILRGWTFETMFVIPANPEVRPWYVKDDS